MNKKLLERIKKGIQIERDYFADKKFQNAEFEFEDYYGEGIHVINKRNHKRTYIPQGFENRTIIQVLKNIC